MEIIPLSSCIYSPNIIQPSLSLLLTQLHRTGYFIYPSETEKLNSCFWVALFPFVCLKSSFWKAADERCPLTAQWGCCGALASAGTFHDTLENFSRDTSWIYYHVFPGCGTYSKQQHTALQCNQILLLLSIPWKCLNTTQHTFFDPRWIMPHFFPIPFHTYTSSRST